MRREHTIQQAALLTGLTPHVIRAWERRYAALTPERTPSNRRLYTDEEILKLQLLRRAVQAGHSISRIAGLTSEVLRSLIGEVATPALPDAETPVSARGALVERCLSVIERLAPEDLERCFAQAASQLGTAAMLEEVVVPLLERIGHDWQEGTMWIAGEHMATVVLRAHLMRALGSLQPPSPAPTLIATTPIGQHHEFGALLVAVMAALEGWRVIYLGSNLPAEEIARAAIRSGAKALALSIVYPADDARLPEELRALRRTLGGDAPILVGGRDSSAYGEALTAIGARTPGDLRGFRAELAALQCG